MQLLEIFLIAAGALLLILSARPDGKNGAGSEPPEREQPPAEPSIEASAKLQTSLSELLGELHSLSGSMAIDLEKKLAELKEVLQLADKKLEKMSKAGMKKKPARKPAPEQSAEEETGARAPASQPRPTEEEKPTPASLTGRYGEIYQMEDQGLPIEEIARQMQMGKGEIQLILSLREKD